MQKSKLRAYAKLIAALAGMILLIRYPIPAAEAARKAIEVWATAFAPAQLPFFVLTPALSTPEAVTLYERAFSRVMRALFGVPGRVTGAVVIAWMSGSPTGAIALHHASDGMTRGTLSRALVLCSSLSPGFLIGAVGAGMLGSAQAGYVLTYAHLLALVTGGLILRRAWAKDDVVLDTARDQADKGARPVQTAVISLMTVCGYMVCFAVGARLAALILPGSDLWLLPVFEVTNGCAALASSIAPFDLRVIAIAFACGLSGLCVLMQNARWLPGVPLYRLVLGKLLHAALSAAFAGLQLWLPAYVPMRWPFGAFETSLLLGSTLLIAVAVSHFALNRSGSNAEERFCERQA